MVGFGRFVAVKNIFNILSLSTHGLFFTDQGPGPGLQSVLQTWAGAANRCQNHLKSNKSLPKSKKS